MAREAHNGPSEPREGNSGTAVPPEESGAQIGTEGSDSSEESFSREYVTRLREEAKENRLKAQRADYLATEVRRLAIREATRGVLADPSVLAWSEEFEGEDGLPDHDRLREAAEALAQASPWLARPRGPLPGQGEHGTVHDAPSLSALLRG